MNTNIAHGFQNSATTQYWHSPRSCFFDEELPDEREGTPLISYYAIYGIQEQAKKIYDLLVLQDWKGIQPKIKEYDSTFGARYYKKNYNGEIDRSRGYSESHTIINFYQPNHQFDNDEINKLNHFIQSQNIQEKNLGNYSQRTFYIFTHLIEKIEKIVSELVTIQQKWRNENKDARTFVYIVNTDSPLTNEHKDHFSYRLKSSEYGPSYFTIDYIDCSNEEIQKIENELNEKEIGINKTPINPRDLLL